jgi:metallo-beta-lactamase family protein
MASIRFLGAAGTVTGSRFLVRAHGRQVLVDAGLFQGQKELRLRNWAPFPAEPGALDAVVLTHAHIDHTGYVPRLAKSGYTGPVYATPPSAGLLGYLWPDAANLHEEDALYANRKGFSRHRPALPFFNAGDAARALDLLRPVAFRERVELAEGVAFTFRRVGHILGAAFIEVETGRSRLLFSGDVGQRNVPILKDPETPGAADYLLLEATYGDRLHPAGSPRDELGRAVAETLARRGVVLIPAFAVGRAQDVLYHLRSLQREGRIAADLPIYLDSPMAVSAVDLYCASLSEHDLEMSALRDKGLCPIDGPSVHFVRDRIESMALNDRKGPLIIISASGMLSGGRILHHLKHRLPNPETTLLFVGFQAAGTLGRRILEGSHDVRIHGQTVTVRAEIREVPALSAHADQRGLLDWAGGLAAAPRVVYLVHGEPAAREALGEALRSKPGWNVRLPQEGEAVELE